MLFRQTLLYLPAQVLGPVFQFISIVAWTHFLNPTEMGLFALAAAMQELAYVATTVWFTLYTLRYHDPNGTEETRTRFLDTETAVLIAASIATALVSCLLPLFSNIEMTADLAVATIAYAITRGLVTHLADRARTEHDTFTYSVFQISWPMLGLFIGLALLAWLPPTATTVLWGYAIAQTLSLIVCWRRLSFGRHPMRASRDALNEAMHYGLPLVLGGILLWVANNGLRFVVEWQQSAAAVGLVTVGWGMGLRVAAFAAMLVTAAAFPVAMQRARDHGMAEGQAQLERNGILLFATLAPAAAGLFAISEPLVRLVVAADYQDVTIAVLPLAILAGAFRNLRIHFGEQVFLLHERPLIPLWNDLVDAIAGVAGCVIGLWLGGLPGAVAGAAAGAGIGLLVTLFYGWRTYDFTFPLLPGLRIALATALMLAAVMMLPSRPDVLHIALAMATGGIVYAVALVALYPELARKLMGLALKTRET